MTRFRPLATLSAAAGALVLLAACATTPPAPLAYSLTKETATAPQTLIVSGLQVLAQDGKPVYVELDLANNSVDQIHIDTAKSTIAAGSTQDIAAFANATDTTKAFPSTNLVVLRNNHRTVFVLPKSNVHIGSITNDFSGAVWDPLPMSGGPIHLTIAYTDSIQPNAPVKTVTLTLTPEPQEQTTSK